MTCSFPNHGHRLIQLSAKVPANTCVPLQCQSYSGISGGILACNREMEDMSMDCKEIAEWAEGVVESCQTVLYTEEGGTRFDLIYGGYGGEGMEIWVGRC